MINGNYAHYYPEADLDWIPGAFATPKNNKNI